jgi:uncharacterized protein YijF (DUF1287 family)
MPAHIHGVRVYPDSVTVVPGEGACWQKWLLREVSMILRGWRISREGSTKAAALILVVTVLTPTWTAAQGHAMADTYAERLVAAALEQTHARVVYDGSYRQIGYPGGDVPSSIGVCTDVVIRAYRKLGVDLQLKVHEDMRRSFRAYPQLWGLTRPDTNIDHRRVPNLQTFFRRSGAALAASSERSAFRAGDLVTWMLPGNLPHIGIATARRSSAGIPLIVHNIGRGPQVEDILFAYRITGHYRYSPSEGHAAQ